MNDKDSSSFNQNKPPNHAVIILASGLSHRLGQPKQLLEKQGKPLINYMTMLALVTQPKAVIVVIPQQDTAITDVIETAVNRLTAPNSSIQIVSNPNPQLGMAKSLSLAIDALKSQHDLAMKRVLIMGVDQVLLSAPHLDQLLAQDNIVVASRYPNLDERFIIDDNKHDIVGVPLVVSYKVLKSWQSSLSGDKGLRHFIRSLAPEKVTTVAHSNLSYDIDTPKQLAYARQQGWLDY